MGEREVKYPKDWHRAGMDSRWIFDRQDNNNNNKASNELSKKANRKSN